MLTNISNTLREVVSPKIDWCVVRLGVCVTMLIILVILGLSMLLSANDVNFFLKNQSPSVNAIFGYDWLGRNVFNRTISGLSISILCAFISTILSTLVASIFGYMQSSNNRFLRAFASTLCDLVCGVPQIVALLLISIALGRGYVGVIVGISLTHWATLSKILCGEIKEIKKTSWYMFAIKNYSLFKRLKLVMPSLIPQILVGLSLMFPHAILHESTITFLGFGLSAETPALGIILSEASTHLATGVWWVAVLPGISLILTTLLIKYIAEIIYELT